MTVKFSVETRDKALGKRNGELRFLRKKVFEQSETISALQARVEALQTAFEAACDYINHSPCDQDITPIQHVKWNIFKDLREAIMKGEKTTLPDKGYITKVTISGETKIIDPPIEIFSGETFSSKLKGEK